MDRFLQLTVVLATLLSGHDCLPTVYSTARIPELPTTGLYVDYMNISVQETRVHRESNTTMESPVSHAKSSPDDVSSAVNHGYVVPSIPVIMLRNEKEAVKLVGLPNITEATETGLSRTSGLRARTKRTLPMFGMLPIFGFFRGLNTFGTVYPQWDYDIEKDGLKTSDIYPVKALKAVKEIVEKTDWDDMFMKMVNTVVKDFVDRILKKIFEKKDRSLDLWPAFRIPALTRAQRLKRSLTGQELWHSSGAHRAAFLERRSIECNLRDICQAGRLLSRLPALQQLTMQLRSPGDESQWDAFLWGMRKNRCSRILCKRGRAPKGSRVPWHLHSSSS